MTPKVIFLSEAGASQTQDLAFLASASSQLMTLENLPQG